MIFRTFLLAFVFSLELPLKTMMLRQSKPYIVKLADSASVLPMKGMASQLQCSGLTYHSPTAFPVFPRMVAMTVGI